jgi:hypothetical protein
MDERYLMATVRYVERSPVRTGRPTGNKAFVERLASKTGRSLGKCKPGPKASACSNK